MLFQEFLSTLTTGELVTMIAVLRRDPDDRQHLNWALQELGTRQDHGKEEETSAGS